MLTCFEATKIALGYLTVICPKHGNKEISTNENGCSMLGVVAKPASAWARGRPRTHHFFVGRAGKFFLKVQLCERCNKNWARGIGAFKMR